MTLKCTKCKKFYSLDLFSKDKRKKNGLSSWCKNCVREYNRVRNIAEYHRDPKKYHAKSKKWCKDNPEKARVMWKNIRKRNLQKLRLQILNAYSDNNPQCVCCKEKEIRFLSLDHVNNDGKRHRKDTGCTGNALYYYLRKNGYPKDVPIQILCLNCNMGKQFNGGVCPHKMV